MKALRHRLLRGHWPDYIRLGPYAVCQLCNFGTPKARPILMPLS